MDMIDFLEREYSESSWQDYSRCFENVDIKIDNVPQDVINVIIGLLGKKSGIDWICKPLRQFEEKTAMDLLLTEKGEKALKEFIMRMPN